MLEMNIIDRIIIIGQFIGIWNSGSLLFRVLDFAFFAINRIRIAVIPPDTVPPIPRIKMKLISSNCFAKI